MKTTTTFRELFKSARRSIQYAVEGVILDFTEQVVARMQSLGMSRTRLAENIGSSPAYVTKVLSGGTNFTLESMVKFAAALDADLKLQLVPKASSGAWMPVIDKIFPAPRADLSLLSLKADRRAGEDDFTGPPAPPLRIPDESFTTTA
jgi:transcriptional regulator with XRE-family HTH domain